MRINLILASALLGFILFPFLARAQIGSDYMPNATPGQAVAMIFHKLSGMPPNFKKWALTTKDYIGASKFDKVMVRDKKAADLQSAFALTSITEPIVISTPVYVSNYSFTNKGFLIESFKEDTYFSYEYGGDAYAIVIPDLIEYQWIAIEGQKAKKIDDAAAAASRKMRVILYFEPKFADKSAQMVLDGKRYWLLSGRVRNINLYDATSKTVLWEMMSKTYSDKKQREILNLYQ